MDDEDSLSDPPYKDDCDNEDCDKLENMESPHSSDQHSGDEEENNSSVPTPPAPKRSVPIKNKRRGRRRGRKKVFDDVEKEEEEEEEEDEEEKNCGREDRSSEYENEFSTDVNDREGNSFLEDSIDNDDMIEEPELPPKRRRKKARPRNASLDSDSSDLLSSDLELGYKILEQMMAFPRAAPFLDRPDENVYGMKDYYEVVAKPMWLMEIDRKYQENEYKTVTELMKDVRQILENCYSYWGSGDPLTKKALLVEEFLEKKISLLPPLVKQLCTLEATHGEDDNEDETEENCSKDEDQSQISENKRYCQMIKKGNFESKLLQRVTKSIGGKSNSLTVSPFLRCAEQEEIEKDVEDWENRVLLVGDLVKQIEAMWELPAIGHFFYLTFNVLNVEPVSQLELERMLLMPQASVMLAKVMTSMLIPPLSRAKLEVGPPMPYSIWTARLKTKVASWYRIYRATGDQTLKVFEQIGVEPEFWLVMGESNLFNDCEFHELSFLQRVWLLKSLCDFLLHNHKRIQDVINKIEPDELREKCLGRDKLGNTYHYFPEFSVVRIYKQAKVTDSKWHGFEAGVEEMISVAAEDIESDSEEGFQEQNAAGIKKLFYKTPKRMIPSANNFKLVASSVEDIRCLIDEFCSSDQQVVQGRGQLVSLVYRLNAIITDLQPIEKKLICSITYIRNKMYKEWTDYKNRDADYVDPGIAYWERREKDHSEKEEKQSTIEVGESAAATSNEPSGTGERRERRSKREHQMRFTDFDGLDGDEDDEELYYEEDDDSEDEWVACPSKKKKKQQNVKQKMKKLNSLSEQIKSQPEQEQVMRKSVNNEMISNTNMDMIKPENIKTEKPDMIRIKSETDLNFSAEQQMVSVKQEPGSSYSPPIKQEPHVLSQTVVRTLVKLTTPVQQQCASVPIKKSKSPDPEIICISDEDPDSPPDVKPIIDDLHSIKTVDCVVPLVDQRIGPRPPYQPGQNLQNQFSGQYLSSGNSNPVYVNSMTSQAPPPTYLNTPQVRATPQPQHVMPAVRSPHNQGVMYRPNSATPIKQSPQSFAKTSPKNTVQPGNKQNYFTSVQNNKQFSPTNNNNRSFVNSSGSPQMNKSPRQSFQSPTVQTQRSPRPGNAPIMQTLLSSSPGRGRPRGPQSIRMPSPRGGTSSVRQMSPQQQINNKGMVNSPRSVLRQRSPQTAGQRNVMVQRSPSGGSYNSPTVNNRPQQQSNKVITSPPPARRNLNFNSPNRQQMAPPEEPPLQIINTGGIISKNATTVEGKLLVGLTDDGNYGYHVVLPDGGKVTLTTSQLAELRAKNGGSLPQKVGVPMVQSSD